MEMWKLITVNINRTDGTLFRCKYKLKSTFVAYAEEMIFRHRTAQYFMPREILRVQGDFWYAN